MKFPKPDEPSTENRSKGVNEKGKKLRSFYDVYYTHTHLCLFDRIDGFGLCAEAIYFTEVRYSAIQN